MFNRSNTARQRCRQEALPGKSRELRSYVIKTLCENTERPGRSLLVRRRITACCQPVVEVAQRLEVGLKIGRQRRNQAVKRIPGKRVITDLKAEEIQLSLFRVGKLFQATNAMNGGTGDLCGSGLHFHGSQLSLKVMTSQIGCLPALYGRGIHSAKPSAQKAEFAEQAECIFATNPPGFNRPESPPSGKRTDNRIPQRVIGLANRTDELLGNCGESRVLR